MTNQLRVHESAEDCWTCASNSGTRRISPAPPVYEGKHWLVEHAYPVALPGWMVIVLRRHLSALHQLSSDEVDELAHIQSSLIAILHETLKCEKEYVACFAEGEHFRHVHMHVVAIPADFPQTLRGAQSFRLLQVGVNDAVAARDVSLLCDELRSRLAVRMSV